MILIISLIPCVIGGGSWGKRIHVPCRGTHLSGVHCPSRGTKTTRIHVSARRFKHLFVSMVISTTRKLNFCFNPVQKESYRKSKGFSSKDRCFSFVNSLNGYGKRTQNKRVTPNKFDYFLRIIQSMLQFMNCNNLHDVQQTTFNTFINTTDFINKA